MIIFIKKKKKSKLVPLHEREIEKSVTNRVKKKVRSMF